VLLRNLYYVVKPVIPWRFRLTVRRLRARRLRHQFAATWPISESAARVPKGWPGWPAGKKFAFVFTHDVEGRVGLGRCRKLAELEMALGFRSAFNFVPEGYGHQPESLMAFLKENGFEVGIHDLRHDGSLYRSRKAFLRQAEKINSYLLSWDALGFRAGFMFHNLQWQHALNILYDASTFDTDPFEPQPDGMNTIFPFWVSDESAKEYKGYMELPSTLAQDSTLFLLLQERDIAIWTKKLDWIAENGGMALLNVHPDYMCFSGKPRTSEYPVALYERFLKYLLERYAADCWFALPSEVARYAREFKPRLPDSDD